MDFDEHLVAIRREGAALSDAARAAGVDAPVPSCPKWTVADLLGHLGRIHRWVAGLLNDRATDRGAHWSASAPPPDDELLDWFAGGVPLLADALAAAGPDASVWTWTNDHTGGFWARRQSIETAVHRVDGQLAGGGFTPVDTALAVDGIDELFDLLPFWPSADRVRGNGETLHFHCTDADGEWLVRLHPDRLDVTREHGKGDVAARGSASDLLLFVYGRIPPDRLNVFGDAGLLAHWRELVNW
jgi:uncharacterized protein (TIGR03083 family)